MSVKTFYETPRSTYRYKLKSPVFHGAENFIMKHF